MKIFYIVHTRMPTDKAYGLTIVRSCESFAVGGAEVTLVMPSLTTHERGDIFERYHVAHVFNVRHLFVLDFLRINGGRMMFALRIVSFYASAFFYMLFRSRKNTVIYTRDVPLIELFSRIGFSVVYECHLISNNRAAFFRRCRHARHIITISDALKLAFVAEGFEAANIMVAPSGVDVGIFGNKVEKSQARRELSLPPDAKIVLYTGNFTTMGADKGITDIILALKEIPDVLFAAVGGADPDIARYRALAAQQRVDERVLLFGHSSQTTLARYQQAADVLLMPFPDTPHYRNHMSPVKMFEYMASGRPIIASDLPTIREVLTEQNAVIVPPGDPQAIAGAIQTLLNDPAQAEVCAAQAREDVDQYTWQNRAARILAFIAH